MKERTQPSLWYALQKQYLQWGGLKSPSCCLERYDYVVSKYTSIYIQTEHRWSLSVLQLRILGWKEGKKGETPMVVQRRNNACVEEVISRGRY